MMIELSGNKRERAIVVGVVTSAAQRDHAEEYLDELGLLADTAGADIIHKVLQTKSRFDAATYVGKGKVEEITKLAEDDNISLIIFDDDLSPAQVRNLETAINIKIVDRSGLILDIFAMRARTNEAKTQVELAQLQYMLPRLTRMWTHLSKQFGGIGTRGPGETQIESDRRMIRERISLLKDKLEKISSQRSIQRKGRKDFHKISLAGYTNVGKSTLLNTLSQSDVFVENRLFATLDATTRQVELDPTTTVLITDTVGFIRKLPHHLIASFKSTLEEINEADIILHVVDISNPYLEDHINVVKESLTDLGAGAKPVIYVFNKVDAIDDRTIIKDLQSKFNPSVFLSAKRGINILGLKALLLESIKTSNEEKTFILDSKSYKLVSQIHDIAEVTRQEFEDNKILLSVKVNIKNKSQLEYLLRDVKQL